MSMVPLHTLNLKPSVRRTLDRKLADRTIPLNLLVEWLGARGYKVNRAALRRYADFLGFRRIRHSRFLRVDLLLSERDRPAYEKLIADPRTTPEQCAQWLNEHGYPHVGDAAIRRHRNRFLDKLDGVRHSARFAQSIVEVARENGQQAMSDGMLTRFEQVMLEQLVQLEEHNKIDVRELGEMGRCVAAAVGSRERFEELRRAFVEEKRKAADACEAAVKKGATGKDVVARMREILGV